MTPTEKRDRAALIAQMKRKLIAQIYNDREVSRRKKMANLVVENMTLMGHGSTSFMYKGEWFFYPWDTPVPRVRNTLNKVLHSSLISKAAEIMGQDSFEDQMAKAHIEGYVDLVLNTCRQWRDLWKVLPGSLFLVYTDEIKRIFNIGDPLTDDEIDALNEKGAKGREALQFVYMTELLLSGT